MNKLLQTYLAIVATFIMLFMAAILVVCIYAGIKISEQVKMVEKKADGLSSQVDSFNRSIDTLNTSIKNFNPFN